MMVNRPLSLFISSKEGELEQEKLAIQTTLSEWHISCWLLGGALSEPKRNVQLKAVVDCDIYIGLFWLGYCNHTIEEYVHARKFQKPCLIYQKDENVGRRHRKLRTFLGKIEQRDNPEGLTIYHFQTLEQLTEQIKKDISSLFAHKFHELQSFPITRGSTPQIIPISPGKGITSDKIEGIKKTIRQQRSLSMITVNESVDITYPILSNTDAIVLPSKVPLQADKFSNRTIVEQSLLSDEEIIRTLSAMETNIPLENQTSLVQELLRFIDEMKRLQHRTELNSNDTTFNPSSCDK